MELKSPSDYPMCLTLMQELRFQADFIEWELITGVDEDDRENYRIAKEALLETFKVIEEVRAEWDAE